MIYKILFPVLMAGYLFLKYRILARIEKGPIEGMVLYPRQDARFAHGVTTVLLIVFVLEFISHPTRDAGAFLRLAAAVAVFIAVDVYFWLRLKNQAIIYDRDGLIVRDLLGKEQRYDWAHIEEVHTSGTGVKHARVFTLKTADRRRIRINEKSGGLQRFRRFMEERI